MLISAVGVVVAIAATIAVLLLVLGRDEVEKLDPVSSSTADVVRVYTAESTEYWKEYDTKNTADAYAGLLIDDGGRTYEVPATDSVVYSSEDASRNFDGAKRHTETLLAESTQFTIASSQDGRELYQTENKYCQLRDVSGDSKQFALACATKQLVNDQIALAKQLYALYEGQAEAVSFDFNGTVSLVDVTEVNETIRYASLSFNGRASTTAEGYPRLLFGSLNGEWEFLANLNNRGVPSDGKRSVSEADLARMNDEKWGGVFDDVF